MSELRWPLPDKVYCYTNGRTRAVRASRAPTSFKSTVFVRESQLAKAEAVIKFYQQSWVKDESGLKPFDTDLGLKAMEYFNPKENTNGT